MKYSRTLAVAVFALYAFPQSGAAAETGFKLLTRIRQVPKTPGCSGRATLVDYGLDINRSGQLDDTEVKGNGKLCIVDPVGVRQTEVSADKYCGVPHPLIIFGKDVDQDGIVDPNVLVGRVVVCLDPTRTVLTKSYATYGH